MITLNTLNSLIDDIMLQVRNSNIVESENINRLQIQQWIDTYRALLLKQDIDKDGDINPDYVQHIDDIYLEVVEFNNGTSNNKMVSTIKLPRPIDINHKYGILSVTDNNGNTIQIGDENKALRQKHRRFTCNDYIAYFRNGYLNIIGPNLIEYARISGVFESPDEINSLNGCPDVNKKYPLPYDKIPTLKQMILERELGVLLSTASDTKNNAKNDIIDGTGREERRS